MERTLFSPRWYRVANLRPQLRAHVELKRQLQRGVPWFILFDRASDRLQRLNAIAYQFVGRCDGRFTVQRIWDELLAAMPDDALTQDEVVQLLIQLHDRGLMQFDVAPDIEALFRAEENQRRAVRRRGVNPLAFRISLGDPSRILTLFDGVTRRLFSGVAFAVWLGVVLAAGIAAVLHWPELRLYAHKALASPQYLLMTWLAYPLVKLVHELAHGLAVRRWGGSVRQAGVMLFILTPVPFVNASAADGFRHRHQRAIVSGAGIAAELLLAALATGVWLAVQPSFVRDLAFVVMLIGGVSTVLANGNPLMRFDGYFLFCDAFDLRNLAARSSRWWQQLIGTRLLGLSTAAGMLEPLPGERFWLLAYAPLAWCYRLALAVGITLWVGGFSTALGVVIGATMLLSSVGQPFFGALRGAWMRSTGSAERSRVACRATLLIATAALVVTLLPLPFNSVAEGVVWLPERAQVRARTEGFVTSIAVADGARVKAGDVLATLGDDRLVADQVSRQAEASELEVQLFDAMTSDPQTAPVIRERLAYARAEAVRLAQKIDDLQVRAQSDGVLVLPHADELPGSFRKQGDLLGYVLTDEALIVRVALPQQDAALVQSKRSQVSVRLAEDGANVLAGQVSRETPQAADKLPSAALGDRGGGRIATDGDDKDGLKPQTPVVLMDVTVAALHQSRIGGRALVRFDHGWMPLGSQLVRKIQQLVLQHFNPGA